MSLLIKLPDSENEFLMDERIRIPAKTLTVNDESFPRFLPFLRQTSHYLNNLLTPLLSYPSLIRKDLPANSASADLLDTIEVMARDMSRLSMQMLVLSSAGSKQSRNIMNLADTIREAASRITSEYPAEGVTVELSLGDSAIMAEYNDEQMHHALDNILANAMDAMEGNGVLRIETHVISNPRNNCRPDVRYHGDYVQILISDTGPGIPSDIRNHLFEPFVTTKKDGSRRRGAGLGLSIVYTVMKNHGGFVDFKRTDEHGTAIGLYLPAIKAEKPAKPAEETGKTAGEEHRAVRLAPRNMGRIMIVDDEKPILKLFQMMIQAALPECEIDTAENGAEAMGLFRDNHHGVVVMDLHMPIMDGQAAFLEVEKVCDEKEWEMPSVIFCTGYAPSELVHDAVSRNPFHCLLQKPIRGDTLVDAIRKRLRT